MARSDLSDEHKATAGVLRPAPRFLVTCLHRDGSHKTNFSPIRAGSHEAWQALNLTATSGSLPALTGSVKGACAVFVPSIRARMKRLSASFANQSKVGAG